MAGSTGQYGDSQGAQNRAARIAKLKQRLADEERAEKAESSRPVRQRQDVPKGIAKVYRPLTAAQLFPAAMPKELEDQLTARHVEEGMDEDDAREKAKAAVADRLAAEKVSATIRNYDPVAEAKRRRG